jgi:transcriptional regulator with XRE-family HTH domain
MTTPSQNTDWIGAWIREARKHSGRSQEALGDAMSLTKGNISAWENNRHLPSIEQLTRISAITGYPLPDKITKHLSPHTEQLAISSTAAKVTPKALEIAIAFDRLKTTFERDAVIAQLRAFGVL